MGTIIQDIRFALRVLLKNPGFTVAVVITLALGIGANSAIFSVVNAVLINPLPFRDSDRIMNLWSRDAELGGEKSSLSPLDFEDFRNQAESFEAMAIYANRRFNISSIEEPERVNGARVSADIFQLLGASPLEGRAFQMSDEQEGNNQIALVRRSLWHRLFGADPNILGRAIMLDGKPFTVVGVMPDSFTFPISKEPTEIWVPINFNQYEKSNRGYRGFGVIGRLKAGVSREQAQAELDPIAQQLEQAYPETNKAVTVVVSGMQDDMVKDVRLALLVILGAVGLVLAVACANIANMLIVRAISREREVGVRLALGASYGRIARQLITEGLLLSLIGCAAGLLVARLGIKLLTAINTSQIPRIQEVAIDGRVLGFTIIVSLLMGLIFGSIPIIQARRSNLPGALKEGRTQTGTARQNRLRKLLIIGEVALCQILLVGAGLLINSFIRLSEVDPGIKPDNVLVMQVSLTGPRYNMSESEVRKYFQEVTERIQSDPGVKSAGVISHLPLSQATASVEFSIEGQSQNPAEKPKADLRLVSPNYYKTMGIPLLNGRDFSERDNSEAPKVIIINQRLASRYFPNEDPVGKRMIVSIGKPELREIIGVVGDVKHSGLDKELRPEVYLPYLELTFGSMSVVIRTAGDPQEFAPSARSYALAVDNQQPVARIRTMRDYVSDSIAQPRFNTILLGIFSIVALVIAITGVYGVTSYSVSQRRQEIGIRIALGAGRSQVLKLIISQAMILAIAGVAIGLAGAFILTRILVGQLFVITPTDSATFALVSVVLSCAVLAASYIPAYRAAKLDPAIVLRYE